MSTATPANDDLTWDLHDFGQAHRAMDFVQQFEATLCVYSPFVDQIYSSYNMFFRTIGTDVWSYCRMPARFMIRSITSTGRL